MIFASGIILSCTGGKSDTIEAEDKISESENSLDMNFMEEKAALKNQALVIINDFNQKAVKIKTDAYKHSKSLDEHIKKLLIETEEQVAMLEERLVELNHQSEETWPAYSKSLMKELETIKSNIQNLSGSSMV